MNFLAPLFLLGGLAIAAPFIFHLIRRTSKEKIPFSSMMFLEPSPPRVTKRSRLEHLSLLLLRCLVLLLLALGFARPFLPDASLQNVNEGDGIRTLILIDTSASMRRSGVWKEAVIRAKKVLRKAGAGDAIAVHAFDNDVRPVISFSQWTTAPVEQRIGLAEAEIGKLEPGWAATRLGKALGKAASMLEEEQDDRKKKKAGRLVLITDLQKGSYLEELQSFEWPETLQLQVEAIEGERFANAGIQFLHSTTAEAAQATKQTHQKTRIYNSADSTQEQFKIAWGFHSDKDVGTTTDVYVPPGQSRVVNLEKPKVAEESTRLMLLGDREPFDNSAWLIPPAPAVVRILYVGPESADDTRQPLYFLQRAFPPTLQSTVQVIQQQSDQNLFLTPNPYPVLIATQPIAAGDAKQFRAAVEGGATALLAPMSAPALQSYLQMFQLSAENVSETSGTSYSLLGEIDFQHPLFAPFADPRFSDFTKIHFWKHRQFSADALPEAKVIARFDNDDPALVQFAVGKGVVLLLAAAWHPGDSQLALSSKFVPLLHSLLELSGAMVRQPLQYLVGDEVLIPFTNKTSSVTVRLPDGKNVDLPANANAFKATTQPGIYTLSSGTNTIRFAVNLDPFESRTEAMPREQLERYGVVIRNVAFETVQKAEERRLKNSEIEGQQKLWRWLIVAALVVLSLEILMAGRLARPSTATEQPV